MEQEVSILAGRGYIFSGRPLWRISQRTAIIAGWVTCALVYVMIPFTAYIRMICVLPSFYGLYYGLTEGAERALVAEMVPAADRGRAYGLYHGAVGLATLPASLMFGLCPDCS